MRLDKSHIGQKFTQSGWKDESYFWLLAITSSGRCLGEFNDGQPWYENTISTDWLPYEEPTPKKEVLMSPRISFLKKYLPDLLTEKIVAQLGTLQTDKPLRVVLKNTVWISQDGTRRSIDNSDIEADLLIKVEEEQS